MVAQGEQRVKCKHHAFKRARQMSWLTILITDKFYCASESPTKFVKNRGSDPTTNLLNQYLSGRIQGAYFLKDSDRHTALRTTYLKPSAGNKLYSFCNTDFILLLSGYTVL